MERLKKRWAFAFATLLMVALTPLPLSAQPGLKRFTPTQTADLTEQQWQSKAQEISAAGRLSDGTAVPWDFKSAGGLLFAENETGLSAVNREMLARSMDNIANLRPPYKEAYCTLDLSVVGPHTKDLKSQALVKRRVESVRRWFIDHGHDPEMILAGAWYGSNVKEVEWQLRAGLLARSTCEAARAKVRRDIATEYAKDGMAYFR